MSIPPDQPEQGFKATVPSRLTATVIAILAISAVDCSERGPQPNTEYSPPYETFFSAFLNKKDFDVYRDSDALRISSGYYTSEMIGESLKVLLIGVNTFGIVSHQPKIPITSDLSLVMHDISGHEVTRHAIYWGNSRWHQKITAKRVYLSLVIDSPMLRKTVILEGDNVSEYHSSISLNVVDVLNKSRQASP